MNRARKIGFRRLKNKIADEYLREGMSRERAEYIGRATAGKVRREKQQKRARRRRVRR